MAKKGDTSSQFISVGPTDNLTFIQSEKIVSASSVKSNDPQKPHCIYIELRGGKSKHIYFASEAGAEKDLRKISVQMAKTFKANNFNLLHPES